MKQVGFGVIGLGNMGIWHTDYLRQVDEAKLVAVADIDPKAGKAAAEKHRVEWYRDYEEMLQREDVKAVSICTPHFLHHSMALKSFEYGKHVLVEKPMALSVGEADEMIESAKKAGVKFGVVFQGRTSSGSRKIKELVEGGALGELYRAQIEACAARSNAYYKSTPWRGTWMFEGGGVMINQTIHRIDELQWLIGETSQVYGRIATMAHEIEVEDLASALIIFKNGVHAILQVSNIDAPFVYRTEVVGEKAKIISEGERIRIGKPDTPCKEWIATNKEVFRFDYVPRPKWEWEDIELAEEEPSHVKILRDFAQAILEDREPLVTGESGRVALEIINAITLSHFKNKVVQFPLDREEYARLLRQLSRGEHPQTYASAELI